MLFDIFKNYVLPQSTQDIALSHKLLKIDLSHQGPLREAEQYGWVDSSDIFGFLQTEEVYI